MVPVGLSLPRVRLAWGLSRSACGHGLTTWCIQIECVLEASRVGYTTCPAANARESFLQSNLSLFCPVDALAMRCVCCWSVSDDEACDYTEGFLFLTPGPLVMIAWLRNRYHASVLFELRQRLRDLSKPRVLRSCRCYIHDVVTHPIQDDIFMEVYWVSEPVGPGPGASVYICGDEVLRFDCFGSDLGHYHFNVRQSKFVPHGELTRIYFPFGSVEDHIENAVVQLKRNIDYGRGMNLDPKVRTVVINQQAIDEAAEWMRQELLRIAALHQQPAKQAVGA